MTYVDAVEAEDLKPAQPLAVPSVTPMDSEDAAFQTLLASEELSGDPEAGQETATLSGDTQAALEAMEQKADLLVETDNVENRLAFLWSADVVVEEAGGSLEAADLEQQEDIDDLKEISADLDEASDYLNDKSNSAENEEQAEIIEIVADITDDTGEVIGSISEIAEQDATKGAEIAEVAINGFKEVGAALNGNGSVLENLRDAQNVMKATHTGVMDFFEVFLGYAYVSSLVDATIGTAEEEAVQRQINEDTLKSENARQAAVKESSGPVELMSGPMAAPTGVDLSGWKLTLPADHDGDGEADEIQDDQLKSFRNTRNMVQNSDGSVTVSSATDELAMTPNSKYPRAEFREMLRAGDLSIDTKAPANNFVTSAASPEEQAAAGGVDGQMQATLSVDRVTVGGDPEQAGRVIIGQVHAENDEPVRLYFHQAPGSDKGSIYFAHEPQNGKPETFHLLLGNLTGTSPDGIALGEAFTYNIDITGTDLTVSIETADGRRFSEVVDMSQSGYADEGTLLYFKAGVYSQNNTTSDPSSDYSEATFYSLSTAHDGDALEPMTNPRDVFDPGDGAVPGDGSETPSPLPGETTPPLGSGLSPDPSTDYAESDANQAILEERFISLYEKLMEKQISFKERVEAFKTDNQNAGKG